MAVGVTLPLRTWAWGVPCLPCSEQTSHLGGKARWSAPPVTSFLAAPVLKTHPACSLSWGPRLWHTRQAGALCPHRQLMHNSNFSSSNGSTEDLFRDSIDSCDNDITEKVGRGTLHVPGMCGGLAPGCSLGTWTLRPPRSSGQEGHLSRALSS